MSPRAAVRLRRPVLPSAAPMGKQLIICEKASVQRDVVSALPGTFKKNGDLFESDEYVVGAASGHLVEQLEPDEYDARYKIGRAHV